MASLRRFIDTVRYLKPVQIYGRLFFRALKPVPNLAPAPGSRPAEHTLWAAPVEREPSLLNASRFCFLGECHDLDEIGWDSPSIEKLWRYNLHYFDALNAAGADESATSLSVLMQRWVAENPPGRGTGWDPYPTSLRIVNWVKWALGGHELPSVCRHSLAIQARWLEKRLEYFLLGNHLFSNAKALLFAGCYFSGSEGDRWVSKALAILEQQLPEQVLADGGQFELSPMYHALALEDLLDMTNICRVYPSAIPANYASLIRSWPAVTERMSRWLRTMCHPDGEISLFNDAAIGIAPAPSAIFAYAERLGINPASVDEGRGLVHLETSGYVRARQGNLLLLADVGQIGPDHLPGHGHADTLSFELSVGNQRFLVNSGTSQYGVGEERLRQRGTSAHNTVVINDENSSEVWSGFRVARRARPFGLLIQENDRQIDVSCSHDGYRRLRGKPVHRREWALRSNSLQIKDVVVGPPQQAEASLLFHPDIVLTTEDYGRSGRARVQGGVELRWRVLLGDALIEPATYHPRFGQALSTKRLIVKLVDGLSEIHFESGPQEADQPLHC